MYMKVQRENNLNLHQNLNSCSMKEILVCGSNYQKSAALLNYEFLKTEFSKTNIFENNDFRTTINVI